jgi:hypothetical protein
MVGEIYAGLSAAKSAFDIAKGLKDIHDATIRNSAIIELQEKILAAQSEQASLIDHIRNLEKQITDFETWETEKQKYDLKNLGYASFAFMLKPNARGTEPPHFVCTNCYNQRRISILQYGPPRPGKRPGHYCPACYNEILPSAEAFTDGRIRWLD